MVQEAMTAEAGESSHLFYFLYLQGYIWSSSGIISHLPISYSWLEENRVNSVELPCREAFGGALHKKCDGLGFFRTGGDQEYGKTLNRSHWLACSGTR